jgi:Ankyrin repeats (many copies)
VVQDGQTVCALGLYSAERNGLVPGYGQAGEGLKLILGDSEPARQALTTSFRQSIFAGSLVLLVSHFLLFNFIAVRGSELRAKKNAAREAAFFQAVEAGDLATVTAELDAGIAPDVRDAGGSTPLMLTPDPRIARRLIAAGADVNARNQSAATPLIHAAGSCNLEVVRLLLQSGADVHARDVSEGRTALDWALAGYPQEGDCEQVVAVLREAAM